MGADTSENKETLMMSKRASSTFMCNACYGSFNYVAFDNSSVQT